MSSSVLFLVIVAVIVCTGVIMYVTNGKGKGTDNGPTTWTPPSGETTGGYSSDSPDPYRPEPSTSRIYISGDFGSGINGGAPEEGHLVSQIYATSPKKFVWICPYCDVENAQMSTKCCVCCRER